jgi:outer membrane protein assembly factor BamD (BamD/ComL family)
MKRISSLIVLVFTVLLLISCGSSHDQMLSKISEMDKSMRDAHPVDTAKVTELIGAYQAFAHKFPKDSLAPEFLYKAAGLSLSFNRSMQALDIYRSIRVDYSNWKKAPECLFMQGFIFENYIKDLVKANEIYNEFIAKYPKHELTDDAENAIKYLGKPLDDVIRDFEAQNSTGDTLKTAGK